MQKHRSWLSWEKLEARLLYRSSSSRRRKYTPLCVVKIEKERKLRVVEIELCFSGLYGPGWL